MADGRITIDTKIDTKGLDDGLKDIDSKMKGVKSTNFDGLKNAFSGATKEAKILGVSIGDIGKSMSSGAGMAGMLGGAVGALAGAFIDLAMKGLQMAIQAMTQFIAKGVELASSIQESMNVINVTFGEDNTITGWIEDIASQFNLAQDEAYKFASAFGTIAKQMTDDSKAVEDMSKVLTALSGDLASFYNTSNEEAFNALRAGLTGEMEQLKKYNVFLTEANLNQYLMSQGIEETTRTMTEQEKMYYRMQYILDSTNDAMGDAIRTSDSYANATKKLELAMNDSSKAVGDGMLPALTSFKEGITELFEDNKEVFTFIGEAIGLIINLLSTVGKGLYMVFEPVVLVFNELLKVFNPILKVMNEVIGGIGDVYSSMTKGAEKEVNAMSVYMEDFSDVSIKSMEGVADATGKAFEDTREAIESELDTVKGALEKYYDKDLKEYEKYLDKKYGASKNSEIKKAQLLADREARNNRLMDEDLKNEAKKIDMQKQLEQSQREAYKAQEDAMKRQSQLVEQETKKQKGFFDDLKKSWDSMFKSNSNVSSSYGSYNAGRNAVASNYNNYSRNSNTSNVFNVSLYGGDFMSNMEQVQMMARLRG